MKRDTIASIIGYVGFVSSILSIVTILYALFWSHTANTALLATLVVFCILNTCLAAAVVVAMRRYDQFQQDLSQRDDNIRRLEAKNEQLIKEHKTVAEILHNVHHEARGLIHRMGEQLQSPNRDKIKELEIDLSEYFTSLLNNVKELFDVITKDQCNTCIKLFTEEGKIETYIRDSISKRKRGAIDVKLQSFYFYENEAFKNILDDNCPNTYYLCNDLKKENGYRNINHNWRHSYNACLVVPISLPFSIKDIKDKKSGTPNFTIGFLCVDNFKGAFDDVIGHNLLASIADANFNVFTIFGKLKNLLAA